MHNKLPTTAARARPAALAAHTITAAARGDHAAWQQLVDRYSSLLWAVTRAHQLNAHEAADVIQTTWLRLIEQLPNINHPNALGAWLATTARRECLRSRRQSTRCQPSDQLDTHSDHQQAGADAPLLRHERDAALWHAFKRLPPRDQALLRMLTTDPTPSYQQIAAALGIAIGSIGPKRARALKRLHHELTATQPAAV